MTFPKYERGLGLIKTDIMRLIWNPLVNAASIGVDWVKVYLLKAG